MKSQASQIRLQFNANMNPEIIITLKSRDGLESLEELKTATDKGKALDCEIKIHRERRSLDANAMMWKTLSDMAAVLKTTKDELYLQMLKKWGGKFTYIVVQPEAERKIEKVREYCESKIALLEVKMMKCSYSEQEAKLRGEQIGYENIQTILEGKAE